MVPGRVGVSPAGDGIFCHRELFSGAQGLERLFRQDAETGGWDTHPTPE